MNRTTTAMSCPKCAGTGHLRAFTHIANGDCFACGASGHVDASTVSTDRGTYVAPPSKRVELPIGTMEITRWGAGFQADLQGVDMDGRQGTVGCAWFDVRAGRVVAVELSNGLAHRTSARELQMQLQSALRV